MGEKKLHYKMYKDGKKFVFAAIATLSFLVFGGVSTVAVHADTTSGNLTAATVNSTSDTKKSAVSSAATVASSASDKKSAAQSAATVASSASDKKSAAQSAATAVSSASDKKSAAQSAATVASSASDKKSAAQSAATVASSASDKKSAAQSAATVASSASDKKSAAQSAATVASSASDKKSAAQSAATVASSASDKKSAAQSAATVASSASDKKSAAQSAATVASSASDKKSAAQSAATVASSASDKKSAAQSAATVASSASDKKSAAQSAATAARSARNRRSVFQLLMALSSNSVQPATSISDDTYLKNLGIDINDLNTNSVLKLASLFHIFANQASLSADTNGNLAVKILNGSNDFGTRGDSYNLTSGDIYYIQQLAKHLQSNAFRNKTFNHVVLGKDVNVSIENNKVLINGITMDNLKPEDVYQDTNGRAYIDFSDVFQQLVKASTSYASTPQSKGVISNYDDMNNRYVDVSKVATGTQIIYVNVPFKYLSAPQPITIKGISQEENGPTIVINVTDIPNGDQNISTQVQLDYDDGTNSLPNSEGHSEPNHVLWNLGTGEQVFNFSSGRFMGSVLAPNATINAGVNIDGNIVANIVNITGGESHRWDIHPQPTKPAPTITTEKKTVNETIHYVYKDGSKAADDYVAKPVELTRQVSTDAVTGAKTYGNWSDQSFAAVKSPELKGYTADKAQIDKQTVNGDSKDFTFTVTYTKNAPTITTDKKTVNETIHYVYKDGSKAADDYVAKPVELTRQVSTDAVTGAKTYGNWSDQSFAAVKSPELKGYTADKAQIDKQTVNGDSKDFTFTVTYTKNAPTITTEKKTVNETIHYVYKDGSKAADDYVAKPVELTRQVSTDAVTGAKTYGNWSDQSFAAVKSPELKGYTADKAQIDKQTVNGDSKDFTFTVTYTKNAPTITTDKKTVHETIHYQGAGNQTPADHTASVDFTRQVSTDAVTGEKTYGAWSADQSFDAVTSPELKGYTADKAQIDKQTVNGDSKDFTFTVTYTKNAPTITTEKKTVNETIHYQGAGNQTPADHTASVDFTRQVSTDAVTGEKTYGAWSADQSFDAVTSPELKGYTADKAQIDKQTVNGDSKDFTFTVTYTKNAPTITTEKKTVNETIHYVYKDGSKAADDYVAKPVELTRQVSTDAVTGAKTYGNWSDQSFDAVTSPELKGYTADKAQIDKQTVNGDSKDFTFTVTYTKNAPTITTEKKTVNETIHYVYKDGSKAADDYVAKPVELTRQVSTDAVTGAKTYGNWSDQSFAAVKSPELKGYTADKAQIDKQTVNGDSKDFTFTVTYTKNAPTITTDKKTVHETIHYVYKDGSKAADDYVAKPVELTRQVSTDAVTGAKTYGNWSDQSFDAVKSPELKGYTADKAQIDKQTVNGDSKDFTFTVTYTKNAPTITTDKKTVHETIHYQGAGNQTPADHTASVDFTRQVSTDAVTGEKTYGAWSADQSFDAVTSPELKGYTADKAQIDKQTVNGDSKDLAFTVTYTKNAPTITTDKKTVHETIHYQGAGNQTPADHTASVDFTRQVSTDAVTGAKTYGPWSADQSFDAVKSPELKGYTADKAQIDKQTVNGDSKDLAFTVTYTKNAPTITTDKKTVHETIHYQGAGNQTPADHTASVDFTRQVSTDAVTGEKTYGPWSAAQSFDAVKSPELKGYTADKAQIDKQTVNGDSKDLEFTVTYTKTPGNGTDTGNSSSNQPGNPSQPSNATNNGVINTSTNTGSKVNNSAVNSPELPQTGENNSQSQTMSSIGILLAMFGSLLGFLGIKKRRND
ncbi:mucin-binding protein [Limosilactobacillus reuteri]|uniref:mucin-binding protein n=1 Tax=Limosilactobacillus reuteri TaxID=1598 RepID=UPI002AAB8BEF|nr:collagen-binding domain-containing protein [Limosilactobacillus reuteri]WPU43516.1 collagen-binding domain-containing protein [Limosilactobacillus reuteri]